jgi:hypothetical protein
MTRDDGEQDQKTVVVSDGEGNGGGGGVKDGASPLDELPTENQAGVVAMETTATARPTVKRTRSRPDPTRTATRKSNAVTKGAKAAAPRKPARIVSPAKSTRKQPIKVGVATKPRRLELTAPQLREVARATRAGRSARTLVRAGVAAPNPPNKPALKHDYPPGMTSPADRKQFRAKVRRELAKAAAARAAQQRHPDHTPPKKKPSPIK